MFGAEILELLLGSDNRKFVFLSFPFVIFSELAIPKYRLLLKILKLFELLLPPEWR